MNWIVFNWYMDEIWKMNKKKYAWNAKWRQSDVRVCAVWQYNENGYGFACFFSLSKLSYATHINNHIMK